MHINLEAPDQNAVQAYSATELKINSEIYQHNLIVSRHELITDWTIDTIAHLTEPHLALLLKHKPDIVIIGHDQLGLFAPYAIRELLSKQRIGLESMSIGAASRTYNVLLSEERNVVLGIIFAHH